MVVSVCVCVCVYMCLCAHMCVCVWGGGGVVIASNRGRKCDTLHQTGDVLKTGTVPTLRVYSAIDSNVDYVNK